jgi:hypothetical protein
MDRVAEVIPIPFGRELSTEKKATLIGILSRDVFRELRRSTWRPLETHPFNWRGLFRRTEKAESNETASRYGGLPWLTAGEPWPLCRSCNRTMHLFIQLNLQTLPTEIEGKYGSGLVQLFCCRRGDCPVEVKYEPNECLARLVDLDNPGRLASAEEGPKDPFPTLNIVNWKKQTDYFPHIEEIEQLEIELTEEECELLGDWGPLEVGDKLAGWPAWIQASEWCSCGICQQPMEHLFQFEPHVNLDYSFGQEYFNRPVDHSCGWLFQCSRHKDQLAFTWQCH